MTRTTPLSPTGALARVRGVLVDMDGTLVDSHAAVERAWHDWALDHGVDPEAVIAVCHGATGEQTMSRFRPDLDAATLARENAAHLRRETDDVTGVVAADGAGEFLAALRRLGLPWAVVTNADRALALARLGAAGIEPPDLVTVDDVPAGKPDPAGYLLGAERIGIPIGDCLAVEDSPTGRAAAQAAGAVVAMLRTEGGDVHVDDLAELARRLEEEG